MSGTVECPNCGEADLLYNDKRLQFICKDCGHVFAAEQPIAPLRIFLSYGHDGNEELVRRIRADLEARGHDVWFDKSRIKAGDDWRRAITEGIVDSNRVLSFLSKHSTRDPGVCLDEIAIAIGVKGGNIQTILVEGEWETKPPASISHIQWLDMHDWRERRDAGESEWERWYGGKLADIVAVVESEETRRFAGEIRTLADHLQPVSSAARMGELLSRPMVGRAWLLDAVDQWRAQASRGPRLLWIMGAPGVGKSAFAAHLAHYGRDKVLATEFCDWREPSHHDARRIVRTLAFQIATRLPDYRKLLLTLPEIGELGRKSASELFAYLVGDPLRQAIAGGRERYLIVIDGLDEAGRDGRNELVELLAKDISLLPEWMGVVATSRPESDVMAPLQGLEPLVIDTATEANRDDIRAYVRRELAPQLNSRPDVGTLVEHILHRSEGVFLYVERLCDDVLRGCLSLDHPEQFPQGLGGVFRQYFQRQFPDLERFRKGARPALRAVIAARAPLPVDVLQRLLGQQDEELRDLLRALGSLFPVTRGDGQEVVRPYHRSLTDWLVDERRAGAYYVSEAEGHRALADCGWRDYRSGERSPSVYMLGHLAQHLRLSGGYESLAELLLDLDWLRAKSEAGLVFDLIRDYASLDDGLPAGALAPATLEALSGMQLFILRGAHRITSGEPFLQVAYNSASTGAVAAQAAARLSAASTPWLRLTNRPQRLDDPSCLQVIEAHHSPYGGGVDGLAVTPDEQRVLSWGAGGALRSWSLDTGEHLLDVSRPEGSSFSRMSGGVLSKLPDGRVVLVDHDKSAGEFRVWDIDTWQCVRVISVEETAEAAAVALEAGAMVTVGSADTLEAVGPDLIDRRRLRRTLMLLTLSDGRCAMSVSLGEEAAWVRVAVSSDGSRAVVYLARGPGQRPDLQAWDLERGALLHSFGGLCPSSETLLVSSDGRTTIAHVVTSPDSAPRTSALAVLDTETGKQQNLLEGHRDTVRALATSADGRLLLSGSWDKTLRLWDLATGTCLRELRGHAGWVDAVGFAAAGRRAVSGSRDGTVRIWDLEGRETETSPGHEDEVTCLAITADGGRAISVGGYGRQTVQVWDVQRGTALHTLAGHSASVSAVAVDPCGQHALSCDWPSGVGHGPERPGELRIWDLDDGACRHALPADLRAGLLCIAVTPDGTRAVVGGTDNSVRVWDIHSGQCVHTLKGHWKLVTAIAVTPDGRRAVSAAPDNSLRVWDIETGECIQTLLGDDHEYVALAPMPDGRRLACVGTSDSPLRVWDMASGECLQTARGVAYRGRALALTPDGRRALVASSADGSAALYDLQTMEIDLALPVELGTLGWARITADGRFAVSVGPDRMVQVWSLRSAERAGLALLEARPTRLAVAADGLRLAIGTTGGHVHLFEVVNLPLSPRSSPQLGCGCSRPQPADGVHSARDAGTSASRYCALSAHGAPRWPTGRPLGRSLALPVAGACSTAAPSVTCATRRSPGFRCRTSWS